jgi:hypothetical protein
MIDRHGNCWTCGRPVRVSRDIAPREVFVCCRICRECWLDRDPDHRLPLEGDWPRALLDAKYERMRAEAERMMLHGGLDDPRWR